MPIEFDFAIRLILAGKLATGNRALFQMFCAFRRRCVLKVERQCILVSRSGLERSHSLCTGARIDILEKRAL